jgi:hypothetical protein
MEDRKLHFLVVVEVPEHIGGYVSVVWKEFLQHTEDKTILPGLPLYNQKIHGERLSESCWLLNVPAGLPFLAACRTWEKIFQRSFEQSCRAGVCQVWPHALSILITIPR